MKPSATCPHRHSTLHRSLLFAAVTTLISLTAAPLMAQPCSSLAEAEMQEYVELGKQAVTAYVDQDYAKSIELNQQARDICDEDPVVAYNLARAYHNNGDCLQALYLYEQLPLGEMADKTEKVEGYMAELEGQCGDSGTVRITCEDPDVELQIAGRTLACPWAGRLPSGSTELVASRGPDFRPHNTTVDITAGSTSDLAVPALKRKDQFGTLKVTCAEGIKKFTLSGPLGDQEVDCPWEGELEVGNYYLKTDKKGQAKTVTVVGMQETRVDKLSTSGGGCACATVRAADSNDLPTPWLLAMGAVGLGLVIRRRQLG